VFAVKAETGNGSKMQWRGFTADFSSFLEGRRGADSLLRRPRNIRHPYLKVVHLPVIALCICRFSRSRGVSRRYILSIPNFTVLRQFTRKDTIIKRLRQSFRLVYNLL